MDNSSEKSRSSETSPLLQDNDSPAINDIVDIKPSKPSIFTVPVLCILIMELCERLTFYGINANLVLFALNGNHLQFSSSEAAILSYVFQGLCYLTPIIGGWYADSKAGKFATILGAGVVYLIGSILLPLGSITYSKPEHSNWAASSFTTNKVFKITVYLTGLILVSIGTGGIKSNVSPFGAEQLSSLGPSAIQAFFNWFYWFINIGALIAFTLVVYVQQDFSYFFGYLIPVVTLLLSILVFLLGRKRYIIRPPTGSVLTTTFKIVREAIKRSRRPSLSSSFVNHWLDRAKMCFGGSYSSWEVEDVKKVYRLLPIFASFIVYWMVYAQMSTSMVFQGKYMDIKLGRLQIPVACLSLLDTLGVLLIIPVMEKIVYPLLGYFNIHLSQLQRIGIGMLIATASMACAGGIEVYRKDHCCIPQERHGEDKPLNVSDASIFYQVPQYFLIGLSEVFSSISGLELAFTEAPKSLQGVVMGVYLFSTGLGTMFGAVLVLIINAITGSSNGKNKWFPSETDINKGKLENYFFLLAVLMFLNFVLYVFLAINYKKKKESAAKTLENGNKTPEYVTEDPLPIEKNAFENSLSSKKNYERVSP
ncbi:solute carrier family 15 member 4-like isoform X2 [Xenia sp. Carnegie-2017]|uniref:solute carrier family 15 member 4-like isoform X2 n=1 Tax=Xenia sp. Carnegie-2017 TaxID=2897299 RepID=UPI001F047132|nr:solute carrier family 15 member 4-like isoform X2 [Xenia sp. Carnegie-2017]XP_046859134.1 solute carrier family 15 member 4-like isoform X2 [Xenia sp. Carnegie-2017]XP_046859135.1 solute carrier family 15 member 4-like isoform X2 [Xenia sp. Carnegie-2017]